METSPERKAAMAVKGLSTDPGICLATEDPTVVDDGSFDPDGIIVDRDLVPSGPYPLGMTAVSLVVTDNGGAMDSCDAKITVEDTEPPTVQCNVGTGTITPPDAPISFTAGALDNCAAETGVSVVINSFDCFRIKGIFCIIVISFGDCFAKISIIILHRKYTKTEC